MIDGINSDKNVLIQAENLSKKFSKSLKRSMVYGAGELFSNLIGKKPRTTQLRKREFWAVDHIDLNVKRGQVLGIIGHNGCGKTTLLRLIAGIYPPDAGRVSVRGSTAALISLGVGFHPVMTGYENIYLNGSLLGINKKEIDKKIEEIIEFSEVGDFINSPTANYSSGMRVRLGFSIAVALEPDVLLLDEILAVGDRKFKAKSFKKIEQLSEQAASILISHNMQMISRICTDIIVMEKGKFIHKSTDVLEGIEHYQQQANVHEQGESGTGLIKLLNIKLTNKIDSQKGYWVSLSAKDSLEVEFSAEIDEINKEIGARFLIYNSEYIVIGETFSDKIIKQRDLQVDETRSGVTSVKVGFPQINLRTGNYSLSLEFFDAANNDKLKTFHAVGSIDVLDNKIKRAAVYIPSEWQVE
ncbi:MAG: ABC transporter ATP-binding protein [Chloroflexota bacterium]